MVRSVCRRALRAPLRPNTKLSSRLTRKKINMTRTGVLRVAGLLQRLVRLIYARSQIAPDANPDDSEND